MFIPVGMKGRWLNDTYAQLLDASWQSLFVFIACAYLTINCAFAVLYFVGGDTILNARPGVMSDVFFFSVQTFATIGYGHMAPVGIYANILVTIEAFLGFAFYAMTTGLVFAKFSRPTARVMFSNVAVIGPYRGVPHLMLRMANQRRNRIVDARAQLVLWQDEEPGEPSRPRTFVDLSLVRNQVPLMQLAWTVMHRIDESSPLHGQSVASLARMNAELIITLSGMDETIAQTVHTRFSYLPEEIAYDSIFENIILRRDDNRIEFHYDKFHTVKPVTVMHPVPMSHFTPRMRDDPATSAILQMCEPK
ncbi:MAG: ion channel [Pseudomonadota bacterium]|nr:ion channel [Pseudomonadota bacterium]